MATRKNLKPPTTVERQSLERFNMNRNAMSARQFRDAVTKSGQTPSVPGVKTNTANWGRWTP